MILKQVAATVEVDQADTVTLSENQVVSFKSLILDQKSLTQLKQTVMNMIYDTHSHTLTHSGFDTLSLFFLYIFPCLYIYLHEH